jgi:23S rRNA (guanosine2251-2'-O)-methyltransferase
MKLNAKQLRSYQPPNLSHPIERKDIYLILDNVLDTYNIGSIFRLADASGVKKIYLCGGSETPPNPRIKKASINTTEWVEWEYAETALEAVSRIKNQESGIKVIAIEQAKNSVAYNSFGYQEPLALVVGHESEGVSQEVLDICDGVVELPMYGVNVSLNVMVSLGIVLYHALSTLPKEK